LYSNIGNNKDKQDSYVYRVLSAAAAGDTYVTVVSISAFSRRRIFSGALCRTLMSRTLEFITHGISVQPYCTCKHCTYCQLYLCHQPHTIAYLRAKFQRQYFRRYRLTKESVKPRLQRHNSRRRGVQGAPKKVIP